MDLDVYVAQAIISCADRRATGMLELDIAVTIHEWHDGDPKNIKNKIIIDPSPSQYSSRLKFSVLI